LPLDEERSQAEPAIAVGKAAARRGKMAVQVDVNVNEKHTLYQVYPRRMSVLTLLFLLGNVGLQVYSHLGLSAVVLSNKDPSTSGSDSDGSLYGTAVNDTVFKEWFCEYGQYNYSDIMRECNLKADTSVSCMRAEGAEGSDDSMQCLADAAACAPSCASVCLCQLVTPNDAECLSTCSACMRPTCLEPLEDCWGITTDEYEGVTDCSTISRRLLANGGDLVDNRELAEAGEDGLYVVYEISFISSVRDAIAGETWAIAIVILICSGIWPYTKNVIMFVCWFVPMTASTRSAILKNLTRLAKWSMVDVFSVIIIVCGVQIQAEIVNLTVLAEPRVAIVTFAIAAMWDLVQGEWMRSKHLELLETCDTRKGTGSTEALVKVLDFKPKSANSWDRCNGFGKIFWLAFCIIQIALTFAGFAVTCMSFTLYVSGSELSTYEYSSGSILSTLLSPDRLSLMRKPGMMGVLMVFYLVLVFIIPLISYISVLVASFYGWNRKYAKYVDLLSGFACLDVFVLGFGIVIAEWDRFINKAISGSGSTVEVSMESNVLAGLYLMIVAVFLGWISELFFAYAFAQTFHPVEQTMAAEFIFENSTGMCLTHSSVEQQPEDTEIPVAKEVDVTKGMPTAHSL